MWVEIPNQTSHSWVDLLRKLICLQRIHFLSPKSLFFQNITNYFIVSLAVADLLVAGFVMPLSVYVLVSPNF